MIEGAPDSLDIRATIAMEQVEELAERADWGAPPVVVLLDSEYEVIHMHILEHAERSPMAWIGDYKRLYGALIELCTSLIVACEVEMIIGDESATGEVVLSEDGVTQTCVGHRHEDGRLIALFDKHKPTQPLTITKGGVKEWGLPGEAGGDVIEAFERLMVNAL